MEQLLQPVTYGSLIYLSTEAKLDSFMFSDGFMDESVKLKNFDSIQGADYYDFSFCLFMVLPYSSNQSFEYQAQVMRDWRSKLMNSVENKLEKRKEQAIEMWNKLESEYQYNLGMVQKSQGQSICFGSSNFMLYHINSFKFLGLYQDDNNNLFLQLVEHPDDTCFFNFDPSLKLQKGRSDNFVYEDEIVHITCVKKFNGKSPFVSLTDVDTIIAQIDQKENWKVNIYEQPQGESEYIKIGQCVWLLSPETQLFIGCTKKIDPFINEKKDQKQIKEQQNEQLKEWKEIMRENLQIQLETIKDDKTGQFEEITSFGLWKIEAENPKIGGELKWADTYYLKHFLSGQYLSIKNNRIELIPRPNIDQYQKNKDKQELNLNRLQFKFVPIDNMIQFKGKTKSTQKISRDAFFFIYHIESQMWISLGKQNEVTLLPYQKDINSFRFREPSLEYVWETYTINSSLKLMLQFMQMTNSDCEREQYDQIVERVKIMIIFLTDFLTNNQIANLNLEQEPQQISRIRQNRFREQYALGQLCCLLIEIFPQQQEFENFQINPDECKSWTLKKHKKDTKLIEHLNFKQTQELIRKRYDICKQAYELLSIATLNNSSNQNFILNFFNQLSEHIGYGIFVSNSLKLCFRDNREILEEIPRKMDIFQDIANKFKLFEPYYKVELLQLLSAFTSSQNSSLYINQEKIFTAIVDNKNFLFSHLMRINYEGDILNVEYRIFVEREYESRETTIEKFYNESIKDFPDQDRIRSYFTEQLRLYSKLCQDRNYACVKNLQELLPRKILLKYLDSTLPNQVKSIFCQLLLNLYVDQEPRSIINKPSLIRIEQKQDLKDEITQRFIELNLTNDIQGTKDTRKWLTNYLFLIYNDLQNSIIDITDDIYNELTLEVIKIIGYMMKFGMFSQYASKFLDEDYEQKETYINQIINYLAFLLEYDFTYFNELKTNQIERSYLYKKQKYNIHKEEELRYEDQNNEQVIYSQYQFLKRYASLFKLMKHFQTKTCKSSEQGKYFILIKKEICSFFTTVLEWREDYYIQCVINNSSQDSIKDNEKNKTLLPKFSINPGEYQIEQQNEKQNKQQQEIDDFDHILKRPFIEVLLLAFYFSQDHSFQNSVINLIHKRYTQRSTLIKNLKKVSIIQESNDSYRQLSTYLNEIKHYISYCQQWLQIIETNIYDEKAEQKLHQTVQKLEMIFKILKDKNGEELSLLQKIFRHLGGHRLILKFLESGIHVIHSKIKYFHNFDNQDIQQQFSRITLTRKLLPQLQIKKEQSEITQIPQQDQQQQQQDQQQQQQQEKYSYKKQFIEYVIKAFTISHQILGKFVEDNYQNQQSIYKRYYQLLEKPISINIGQIEFLQQLFLNNLDLCLQSSESLYNYILQLIHDHGQHPEFIEIMIIQLEIAPQDNVKRQNEILKTIEDHYTLFNPFVQINKKSELPNFYSQNQNRIYQFKQKFIRIINTSISSDVSVNHIVEIHKNLTVQQLLKILCEDCKYNSNLMKKDIYNILIIYFKKIDKGLSDFQNQCNEFAELLKIISNKLNQLTISKKDQSFIAIQIVDLVNIYFTNFLKDIGSFSLKMLANDQKINKELFIFEFAQQIIHSLNKFNRNPKFTQTLQKLGENFSISDQKQLNFGEIKEKFFQTVMDVKKNLNNKKVSENQEKWQEFINGLLKKIEFKKQIQLEKKQFKDVILKVTKMFIIGENKDIKIKNLLISKDDVIIKLLQYIQYWKIRKANYNSVIFIIKSLRYLLRNDLKQDQNIDEKEIIKMQNHLNSLNVTQIALQLYWEDKSNQGIYIYQLIKWIISLLTGGNQIIQNSILKLMKSNSESEAFFQKIYNILTDYMSSLKKIKNHKKTVSDQRKQKQIQRTLQVIQLLCEGHNNQLQDYLRQQTSSKISYDIVSLMVRLVITNKICQDSYNSVVQCLDTLTEVVQGPCKENQLVIVTSKFLQWALDLLKDDPKLFEEGKILDDKAKLTRLKYKCTNTLLSLMEMQEENEEVMNRIIRGFPLSILINELGKLYKIYKDKELKYVIELFNADEKNEFIIEYGFNLFILINILILKNKKSQESEFQEIQTLVNEYQIIKKKSEDTFENLLDIKIDSVIPFNFDQDNKQKSEQEIQKDAFKFFAENTVFIEILRDDQLQKIYFPLLPQCKMLPKETKEDFYGVVDHNSSRDKLAFLLKEGNMMKKSMEHEEYLRKLYDQNTIVKLIANHKTLWETLSFITNCVLNIVILCSYSSYSYIDTIPQIYQFSFNRISMDQTWVNEYNLYYQSTQFNEDLVQQARIYQPHLFFMEENTWTNSFILILGILNLVFSGLSITFFFIKKAPLLLSELLENYFKINKTWNIRLLKIPILIINSFIICFTDYDFAFYSGYVACAILGLVIHPFIFVFMLSDFFRIKSLSIVIKAIWISKVQIALSFLMFLLIEYYFSIIGYLFFWDQYSNNSCQQIWRCFLQTFDQTFKNGGAIGDYLVDPQLQDEQGNQLPINYNLTYEQQKRFIYRFIFDVLFKFILVFLIINMVAGIIIDTFGSLKDEMMEKKSNLEDFCFICGIESEKLDKSLDSGHYSHVKKNHHMWNYVYYKVYLMFKNKTELQGNETYVKKFLDNNEIEWFPLKRAIGYIDENDEDEEEQENNLPLVQETFQEIQELEQKVQITNQKLKHFLFSA